LNDANLIKKTKSKQKQIQIISRIISRSTTKTDLIYQWINLNKTITLERKNNRAHRHRSKEFLGRSRLILIQLRNITKLKIVARGTTLKAFGEKKS
jgi:hypothetical protein